MPFAQKDIGMGAYDVSVDVNGELDYQMVPENPHAIKVHPTKIVFHCPGQIIPVTYAAGKKTLVSVEEKFPKVNPPDSLQVTHY